MPTPWISLRASPRANGTPQGDGELYFEVRHNYMPSVSANVSVTTPTFQRLWAL